MARFGSNVTDSASTPRVIGRVFRSRNLLPQRSGRGYGFQWWTYDDGSFAAQGIFGQGIFIDPQRRLVIASNSNWTRASRGPEPAAREEFYAAVQAAVDRSSR
jgi:CubicO group peptidase (beta-lactamase class C family)